MVDEESKGVSKFSQTIIFSGPAVDDGSMDAKDFAPFLMAFAELSEEVYFHCTKEKTTFSIRVKADIKKGSFEFSIDAITGALLGAGVETLLLAGVILGAKLFWRLLIILFNIFKDIEGKEKNREEELENSLLKIETEEEITKKIDFRKMVYDKKITKKMKKVFAPLAKKAISKIIFVDPESKKKVCEISENDIKNFIAIAEDEEGKTTLPPQKLMVEVETVQFDTYSDKGRKWRFKTGPSEEFTAMICDQDFLGKINRKEISFTKGDLLKVERETTQKQTEEGLKSEHKIIHVIDYTQGGVGQKNLILQ